MSATALTFGQLRRGEFSFTKGSGCVYLLESKTLFKIGSTHQPHVRIYQQPTLGPYEREERLGEILISAASKDFRRIEARIHRCLGPWRAIIEGRYFRPRETYFKSSGLLPFVKTFIHSNFDEAAWAALTAACDERELMPVIPAKRRKAA